MAGPMRDPLDTGHRTKVAVAAADPHPARAAAAAATAQVKPDSANFEYDDNEWDIGIGDLIIDLDADIEKTNERTSTSSSSISSSSSSSSSSNSSTTPTQQQQAGGGGGGSAAMASTTAGEARTPGVATAAAAGGGKGAAAAAAKLAIEHSATVDKGLKMKIKRTKPGTKTSEAKHEIVKPGELNGGGVDPSSTKATMATGTAAVAQQPLPPPHANSVATPLVAGNGTTGGNKRGSSGHRRSEKARDKPKPQPQPQPPPVATPPLAATATATTTVAAITPTTVAASATAAMPDAVNGLVRVVFPAPGPGPPPSAPPSCSPPPSSPPPATAAPPTAAAHEAPSPSPATSPPPPKKSKLSPAVSETKEMVEVCVGTSVGTITEPDCLGPCEPGTSVTLEGIVWHETEGVLVVNVTWRGKTYVGTLLDCTRHDWAPPRFCDSPTSDLDARTPKGRGKRGRGATSTNPTNDLINFTETRSSVHSKLRSNNNGGVKGRRGPSSPTPFTPPKPEVTPNKRKPRAPEEETPSKKTKTSVPTTTVSATTTVTSSTAVTATATTTASSTAPSTVTVTNAPICSPPASPVLFECPEPNCCKKYKNINGLKYHQSHAHGSADDEEAKESTSTSEAEEAPSPVSQMKKEDLAPSENLEPPSIDTAVVQPVVNSVETDQTASLPSPQLPVASLSAADKSLVKPGVLRFAAQEEPILNVPTVPTVPSVVSRAASVTPPTTAQSPPQMQQSVTPQPPQLQPQQQPPMQTPLTAPLSHQLTQQQQTQPPQLPPQQQQQQQQPPMQQPPAPAAAAALLTQQAMAAQQQPVAQMQQTATGLLVPTHQPPQHVMQPQAVSQASKVPQFKVKPASALMPDDKKAVKPVNHKKKMRKSPAGSPHPHPLDPPPLGIETGGREEVQSPAYSDISDDAAPLLESEVEVNKSKPTTGEKKVEVGPGQSPHYGMYPYYGQPPYLVPSVTDNKPKELSLENKTCTDKDKKEVGGPTNNDYQQKLLPQHYYPYGYVPGYPYNLDAGYPVAMMTTDDKGGKDEKNPVDGSKQSHNGNQPPIHIPNPNKVKTEPGVKDKHQNENHQIIKESIEIKNQMSPAYLYSRQHQQQQQQQHQQHHQAQQQAQQQQQQQQQQHQQQQHHMQAQQQQQQQQEDLRRYYIYNNAEQRRKEQQQQQQQHGGAPPEAPLKATPPPPLQSKQNISAPSPKHKDKQVHEDKKEEKVKQEGVKPTMETQGPPPPPTSSYAYIHPGHMQSPYYGAIPFDPSGHAVYRGMNPMLVPSPYPNSPYLHPQLHAQIPRYHAPEDLSRPPAGAPKALDLLQHHANQYYSSHKIHELQERAMKSPTPKTVSASASPSAVGQQVGGGGGGPQGGGSREQAVMQGSAGGGAPQGGPGGGKQQQQQSGGGEKECRSSSPPPQRHVHTHHHTHVGLGYPILAGNYPAPYGAAVLASQQAAAAAVVGAASVVAPYPPQSSPSATASSK